MSSSSSGSYMLKSTRLHCFLRLSHQIITDPHGTVPIGYKMVASVNKWQVRGASALANYLLPYERMKGQLQVEVVISSLRHVSPILGYPSESR